MDSQGESVDVDSVNSDIESKPKLQPPITIKINSTAAVTLTEARGFTDIDLQVEVASSDLALSIEGSPARFLNGQPKKKHFYLPPDADRVEIPLDLTLYTELRPMYKGRVISPGMLGDPAVREVFLRELTKHADSVSKSFKKVPKESSLSDFDEIRLESKPNSKDESFRENSTP